MRLPRECLLPNDRFESCEGGSGWRESPSHVDAWLLSARVYTFFEFTISKQSSVCFNVPLFTSTRRRLWTLFIAPATSGPVCCSLIRYFMELNTWSPFMHIRNQILRFGRQYVVCKRNWFWRFPGLRRALMSAIAIV